MVEKTGLDLSLEFLQVTEGAAIATARTMGQGEANRSDQMAVEEMRRIMDSVRMNGTIVIGEGERDKAPMLYIGENVGTGGPGAPEIDIAVDPLEGTNLCATGTPNAIAVMAAAEKGGLLNAPDIYMDKIVVGPSSRGQVDLDAPVEDNLKSIARCLGRSVQDLVIVVLDRPRHEDLIAEIRRVGARIKLIGDGDLSAGISAAVRGSGIHAVMGVGGAPEGVLTAAAMRCLNGEILGRLRLVKDTDSERMAENGHLRPRSPVPNGGSRPGLTDHLLGDWSDDWGSSPRCPILRRRVSHPLARDEHRAPLRPLRRHDPRTRRRRREDPLLGME